MPQGVKNARRPFTNVFERALSASPRGGEPRLLASAVTTKEVTDEDSGWPAQRESEKNAVCIRKPDGRANGYSRPPAEPAVRALLSAPDQEARKALASIEFARPFAALFQPCRYKVFYGGRGGAKSWAFARALLALALQRKLRILCAREFQTSISDSVMSLLVDQMQLLGLRRFFRVHKTSVTVPSTGSEFKFTGLRINPMELKSFEGADICWVEEAQRVSRESWDILKPTIRKEDSEIWVSFNPDDESDPTYKDLVVNTPKDAVVVKVNWDGNPWFPAPLEKERLSMLETDPDAYDHIWEGNCRHISDAVIFRGKFSIETFETPAGARFLHGADWGFAVDPTVLVRCFEKDKRLYVDQECYALGLDLDKIAETWRKALPGCDKWQIYADSSQPQTINHVKGFGFRIGPAKKWPGSVEDGITFLRGYKKIIVHERCYYTGQEMRLYSYKTDRVSGEILPVVLDKHNHCIDAIRYALDKRVKRRGGVF
jgi:phage terminase large subunit